MQNVDKKIQKLHSSPLFSSKSFLITAAEDIGLSAPDVVAQVSALAQAWEFCRKMSYYVSPHHLTMAVMLLCRAPKSTEVEDAQTYIMEKKKQGWRLEIPEWALDAHTKRGRALKGENWAEWYRFRHEVAKIPENRYTQKLKEIKPEWFDEKE